MNEQQADRIIVKSNARMQMVLDWYFENNPCLRVIIKDDYRREIWFQHQNYGQLHDVTFVLKRDLDLFFPEFDNSCNTLGNEMERLLKQCEEIIVSHGNGGDSTK